MAKLLTLLMLPGAVPAVKAGPLTRPVTQEDQASVDALFAATSAAVEKADSAAYADLCDFPVMMVTDDQTGTPAVVQWDRATFLQAMGHGMGSLPKGATASSHHQAFFLSDALVSVEVDDQLTVDGHTGRWHWQTLLVRRDGKLKIKVISEAGWGEMMRPRAH